MENDDLKWFATSDLSEHKGRYVIILDQKVVLYGKNLKELLEEFRKKYPDRIPKVAKLPEENLLVLFLR